MKPFLLYRIAMKALILSKFGNPKEAFKIAEVNEPSLDNHEVLIESEGFGINYADIMAMQGDYRDCPKLPAIIGYDVVGRVIKMKGDCGNIHLGDRVVAMTRFGGYGKLVATHHSACAKITDSLDIGKAMALATQYSTAYYCFNEMLHLYKGDKVLIHSAAGGVGNALVQMALDRGCEVFATCGSQVKINYLKEIGVHHALHL